MATILVIDDDSSMLDLIRLYLENAGHTVLTESGAREGIGTYAGNDVDLVIVDIFMPQKDGIETIIELRGIKPEGMILAISGGGEMGGMEYLSYAKVLGANSILAKPFQKDELVNAVHKVLNN